MADIRRRSEPGGFEPGCRQTLRFYQNSGYIQARVGRAEVEFKDDWIDITIKID
jgi:outer membrane protein assembly factor BamA